MTALIDFIRRVLMVVHPDSADTLPQRIANWLAYVVTAAVVLLEAAERLKAAQVPS